MSLASNVAPSQPSIHLQWGGGADLLLASRIDMRRHRGHPTTDKDRQQCSFVNQTCVNDARRTEEPFACDSNMSQRLLPQLLGFIIKRLTIWIFLNMADSGFLIPSLLLQVPFPTTAKHILDNGLCAAVLHVRSG